MSHPIENRVTNDWQIEIVGNLQISFGLRIGVQQWNFHSPRLRYTCKYYVPLGGLGISLGAEIPTPPAAGLLDRIPGGSQENIRVLRSFSAGSLDGGSVGSVSVGAQAIFFHAEGEQLSVKNRAAREIVRMKLGGMGLGAGVEVNLASFAIGTFYGPYRISHPRRVAA